MSEGLATCASRLVFLDGLRVLAILLVVSLPTAAPFLTDSRALGQPKWYLCLLQNPSNRAGVPLAVWSGIYLLAVAAPPEHLSLLLL